MANEKTKRSLAALAHVVTYALPFLFLSPSVMALVVIVGTHFVIDRWRLARYVVWAKNWLAPWHKLDRKVDDPGPDIWVPPTPPWSACQATGYPPDRPPWLAVWLLIIADNIMHVLINAAALMWL
jgi:hypothetical protein